MKKNEKLFSAVGFRYLPFEDVIEIIPFFDINHFKSLLRSKTGIDGVLMIDLDLAKEGKDLEPYLKNILKKMVSESDIYVTNPKYFKFDINKVSWRIKNV